MWLAVDRSNSLGVACGGGSCWDALRQQLFAFMDTPWTAGRSAPTVLVGGSVFPLDGGQCDGTGYGAKVALGYLPGDFQEPGTKLRLGEADGPEVEVVGFG